MTIDITNPEHCEALAWAYEALRDPNKTTQGNGLKADALVALSNPAKAAELIRQLVERAGIKRCAHPYPGMEWMTCCRIKSHKGPHAHCLGNDGYECVSGECATEDAMGDRCAPDPKLITRLLALPPNAGADAVLAALRGEG